MSQDGFSPLIYAALKGHAEVITQLISAGANIDLLSTKVYTNYHDTCMQGCD